MSSLGSILPGIAGAAAGMIPGVGPFIAPVAASLVGQAVNGGGGQPQQGGAPNPYGQIGGSLLSGAEAAQLAKQNQQTAQNIMNDALGKVSAERGNVLGDFLQRAGGLTDPSTQPRSAFTIDPRVFSGVRAPQVGSVFGSRLGSAAPTSYAPSSFYGDALQLASSMLGKQPSPIAPVAAAATTPPPMPMHPAQPAPPSQPTPDGGQTRSLLGKRIASPAPMAPWMDLASQDRPSLAGDVPDYSAAMNQGLLQPQDMGVFNF